MTMVRRFSQAISEGDGISVVVLVDGPDAALRAQEEGAEGLLVRSGREGQLPSIREAVSVPILFYWQGQHADRLEGADACMLDFAAWSEAAGLGDTVRQVHVDLDSRFELALRVEDEEQLEVALERFDPELFVLAGAEDDPLERVLDLLPDVPAGKLVLAELPDTTRADVDELERAGVDGVIVGAVNVADLIGEPPPEV
jgi:indole-3-glycerol phosphate synthase